MTAIKKILGQILLALLASAIGIFVVYQVHFMDGKISMFGNYTPGHEKIDNEINNRYFDDVLSYHKTEPSFKRRLFTTFFIEKAMSQYKLSSGEAFLLVNFSLFFLCGVVLFFLSLSFNERNLSAFMSVLIFFTSLTIITAFFASNYTYDEPMQYLLLFVSVLALRREKTFFFFLFFTAGILSRESSLLLIPGFAILFLQQKKWNALIMLGASIIIYYCYQNFLLAPLFDGDNVAYQSTRFDLMKMNFDSPTRTLESIMSAFAVLGVATYFFVFRKTKFKEMRLFFLSALVINTLVIWGLANASESRLFALPLLFFWPLAGQWLCAIRVPTMRFETRNLVWLTVLLILITITVYFITTKYTTTYLPVQYHFHKQYILGGVALIFFCEVYRLGSKIKH